MIQVGERAPSFSLQTDGGGTLSSADLAGRPYVLYFYPKDNTPGCTTEACDFRDNFARIQAAGATVVGVSRDSVKSHDGFKRKHELPFPLVSDPALTLHQAVGAWGHKKMYGKDVEGTIRTTLLIDPAGVVRAVWSPVKVAGHVDAVLQALNQLQAGSP